MRDWEKGQYISRSLLALHALMAVVFFMLPLVVIIGTSFTTTGYLKFPPEGFTLKWYVKFLTDGSYLHSLLLSGALAFSATLTAAVLGVPVSLVLARGDTSGKTMISALFLSPLILPPIVIGAALLQFATITGIARSFFALYVGHVVLIIPYIVRTTLASLSRFNTSLEEASQAMGESGKGLSSATHQVSSNYFEVIGRVRLGSTELIERSVIQRDDNQRIVWRERGVLAMAPLMAIPRQTSHPASLQ